MALVERGGSIEAHRRKTARAAMPRAVLDLRLPWPLARAVVVAGVLGAVVFGMATSLLGSPLYHGELSLFVPKLNRPNPERGVEIIDRRITALTAIARSQPFLLELQRESGVDLTLEELQEMVEATRPNFGAIAAITVTGTDRETVERLNAHLSTAMTEVVDRLRRGALQLPDSNGLNVTIGDDPEYTGPLYLELFQDPSGGEATGVTETSPRVAVNTMVGFAVAVLVLVTVAALLHQRMRATDREDLETLLDLDQLGSVPRPDRRRGDGSARALVGFANALAALADEPHAVALGGSGTRRIRSRFARSLAAASAAATGRSTVLVDLDPRPLSRLRRSEGLFDFEDWSELDALIRPIGRWSVPSWVRPLGRGTAIGQIGTGRVALSGDVAEERLAATVAWLAERYVVIINLPELPGPMPVGAALAAVDVGVVMLMDGWTVIDDAKAVADALDAAVAGPVGYALMEN